MQYQSECLSALKSVVNIQKPFEKSFMDVMKNSDTTMRQSGWVLAAIMRQPGHFPQALPSAFGLSQSRRSANQRANSKVPTPAMP